MSIYEKFIADFLKLKIDDNINDADLSHIRYIHQLTATLLEKKDGATRPTATSTPSHLLLPNLPRPSLPSTPLSPQQPTKLDFDSLIDHDEEKEQVALSFSTEGTSMEVEEQQPTLTELLANLKTKAGKPWQQSSLKTVATGLEKLSQDMFHNEFNIQAFIAEPEAVWNFLAENKERAWFIRHLASIFRDNNLEKADIYEEYRKKTAVEGYTYADATPRPKGWHWNRVLAIYDGLKGLKNRSRTKQKLLLLLAFYIELIPLRQETFYKMGWEDNEDSEAPNDFIDLVRRRCFCGTAKPSAPKGRRPTI